MFPEFFAMPPNLLLPQKLPEYLCRGDASSSPNFELFIENSLFPTAILQFCDQYRRRKVVLNDSRL